MTTSGAPLLVFRLSSLGDVLHTIPAVVAMSNAGFGPVRWVIEPAYKDLVRDLAQATPVEAPLRGWRMHPWRIAREAPDLLRKLQRCGAAAVAVDFQGLLKSALLMKLSGSEFRWSFDQGAIRDRSALVFSNRRAAIETSSHVVEWNLALASAVAGRELKHPDINFSSFIRDQETSQAAGRGRIVLHPGAGRPGKIWPEAAFVELARSLARDHEVTVLWGPAEEGRARRIAREGAVALAPRTGLREMAALLGQARLLIGGDSGPLHLAAAMATPVLGLYGPTSVRRNGPWGQLDRCLESVTGELGDLSPDSVRERARGILSSTGEAQGPSYRSLAGVNTT